MSDENTGEGQPEVKVDPAAGIEIETSEAVEAPKAAEPADDAQTPETAEGDNGSEKKSREARARERHRQELEQRNRRIAELEAKQSPTPQMPQPNAASDEPQVKDFTDVLDYLKAHQKWEVKEGIKESQKVQKEEAEKQATAAEKQKKVDAYDERLKPVLEYIPDLPERTQELYEQGLVTPHIENAVLDSPLGELVTVHLLNNPQELVAMRNMSEAQTYRAIALIEADLKSQLSKPVAASKKTNAAAPINPIGKKASTATKSAEEMSQQEWEAHAAKLSGRR